MQSPAAAVDPTTAPKGCGPGVSSVFYNLCDLTSVWGVAVEAVAAAGVVTSFILFLVLLAHVPCVTDRMRKSTVALQAGFLVFTLGLFGLAFAFIVERFSASCAVRRFLFGVLFAGCFACLATHALWLSLVERRDRTPRSWALYLGALALWSIEVIINAEWLIITSVRPPGGVVAPDQSCNIANQDFVTSLVYVLVLLLAVVLSGVFALALEQPRRRRDGVFILVTGLVTVVIWVIWMIMYMDGNRLAGKAGWDDPTLAIALVSNAWVFLAFYSIPQVCFLVEKESDKEELHDGDHVYPARSLVCDNILKQPDLDNKAFSLDESPTVSAKPLSPYEAYNGQVRSRVYQPTEIALVSPGLTQVEKDAMMTRATTPTLQSPGSSSSLPRSVTSVTSFSSGGAARRDHHQL